MATDGANEDREPLKFFPDVGDTVKDDTLRRFSDPIGAQYQRSDARDAIESFLRARAGELKSGDLDVREESADEGANTLRIRYSQYLNDLPILAGAGVAAQQARPRRRWPIRCPTPLPGSAGTSGRIPAGTAQVPSGLRVVVGARPTGSISSCNRQPSERATTPQR
jgi:hypothetical protein